MESSLTKAYKVKIQNFEGPFDLLYHLIEKNQFNIYDIPINEITDQYMEYLFAMQEMDLEIASEFLVMASTLLHIKSKMLLPEKKEKQEEEELDPREELITRLIEYKKYKEFSEVLKEKESQWERVYYKLPEVMSFEREQQIIELSPVELKRIYEQLLDRNKRKVNTNAGRVEELIQHEKVSLKSKMREVLRILVHRSFFKFSELFTFKSRSRLEVTTGFLAVLELAKLKRIKVEQKKQFSEILVYKTGQNVLDDEDTEEEKFG